MSYTPREVFITKYTFHKLQRAKHAGLACDINVALHLQGNITLALSDVQQRSLEKMKEGQSRIKVKLSQEQVQNLNIPILYENDKQIKAPKPKPLPKGSITLESLDTHVPDIGDNFLPTTGILAENKIIEVKDAYKKVKAELLGGRLMDAQEALVSKKLRTTH
jgi:hypothetical protein